jgi:ATP diphosphatase
MTPSRDISRLIEIMAALRTPETGCPWDLAQTFETIIPYTQEEAAEVAEAIARGDREDLADELGDLLLQVVFHARIAEEEGSFAFPDVVEAITTKLIRRHPHVFGEARKLPAAEVNAIWEAIKAEERQARARRKGLDAETRPRVLDGVPKGIPVLLRAAKLQDKAGTVGFDWNDPHLVLAKIREELDEVEDVIDRGTPEKQAEEIGDLLFAVTNLARHLKVDPDMALRQANLKFERRFNVIEDELEKIDSSPADASLEEMEALWQKAKLMEKSSG